MMTRSKIVSMLRHVLRFSCAGGFLILLTIAIASQFHGLWSNPSHRFFWIESPGMSFGFGSSGGWEDPEQRMHVWSVKNLLRWPRVLGNGYIGIFLPWWLLLMMWGILLLILLR